YELIEQLPQGSAERRREPPDTNRAWLRIPAGEETAARSHDAGRVVGVRGRRLDEGWASGTRTPDVEALTPRIAKNGRLLCFNSDTTKTEPRGSSRSATSAAASLRPAMPAYAGFRLTT